VSYFSETIAAYLKGRVVRMARLVEFDFATTPLRLWNGAGRLRTNDDREWFGTGQLGAIDGTQEALNNEAVQMRSTISGVPAEIMALVKDVNESEYAGRIETVSVQFFDEKNKTLDAPYQIAAAFMDGLEVERKRDGKGNSIRTITVTAEGIFAGRGLVPNAYYDDACQQARFPGDLGCSFVADGSVKSIKIPW
jgi:hypothetical protein